MDENTIARFWPKVDVRTPDECWEWKACRNTHGYGRVSGKKIGGKKHRLGAHRVAWMLANGADSTWGLHVLHKCDNPPCCNPDHLFLGTQADNMADMTAKGRDAAARGTRGTRAKRASCAAPRLRRRRPWIVF